MKRFVRILLWMSGVALLPAFLVLFHLGPPGIRAGDQILCAQLETSDGVRLLLVAHRNDDLGEPYRVELYRVEKTGEAFAYGLGDEESYWWRASLRLNPQKSKVEIRALGQIVAEYWLVDKTVRNLPDDGRHNYGWLTGSDQIKRFVPPDDSMPKRFDSTRAPR